MAGADWLPARTNNTIDAAVRACKEALGSHLRSIALVGAAANPQRQDRAQAPELLAVASEVSNDDLHRLATALRSAMRHNVRVRVLTADELETSADVFALEVAEYQFRHHMLHGDDPFAAIAIAPTELRHDVERGLRGLGRRVRNRVLAAVGSDGRREDPQRAAAHGLERLLVLCRHALTVLGEDAPSDELEVVDRVAQATAADLAWVPARVKQLRAGKAFADPLVISDELLRSLPAIVTAVDKAEVPACA